MEVEATKLQSLVLYDITGELLRKVSGAGRYRQSGWFGGYRIAEVAVTAAQSSLHLVVGTGY